MTFLNSDPERRTKPFAPTPAGTEPNSAAITSCRRGRTSSSLRSVRMSRIPQLMSNPMPPGEITPESARKAATPPIGKP